MGTVAGRISRRRAAADRRHRRALRQSAHALQPLAGESATAVARLRALLGLAAALFLVSRTGRLDAAAAGRHPRISAALSSTPRTRRRGDADVSRAVVSQLDGRSILLVRLLVRPAALRQLHDLFSSRCRRDLRGTAALDGGARRRGGIALDHGPFLCRGGDGSQPLLHARGTDRRLRSCAEGDQTSRLRSDRIPIRGADRVRSGDRSVCRTGAAHARAAGSRHDRILRHRRGVFRILRLARHAAYGRLERRDREEPGARALQQRQAEHYLRATGKTAEADRTRAEITTLEKSVP